MQPSGENKYILCSLLCPFILYFKCQEFFGVSYFFSSMSCQEKSRTFAQQSWILQLTNCYPQCLVIWYCTAYISASENYFSENCKFSIFCGFRARKTRSSKATSCQLRAEELCIYSPAVDGKIAEAVSQRLDAEKPAENGIAVIWTSRGQWRLVAGQVILHYIRKLFIVA